MATIQQFGHWLRQRCCSDKMRATSAGKARGAHTRWVPLLARRVPLLACPAVCAILLVLQIPSRGVAAEPDDAVKSGGRALRSDNRFPWYDAQTDDLRPIELRPIKDDENSDSDDDNAGPPRRGRSKHQGTSSAGHSRDNGSGHYADSESHDDPPPSPSPSMTGVSAPWLIWIVWIAIGGVLASLAVMLIRAFLNREARKANTSDGESIEAADDGERLNALPLPAAPRRKRTLLEEARHSYEAGDYNAAIVYLYTHQLLKLDQNQWIRLAKGKTNREYLRELSGRGELQGVLARTMVPFEDVYFGDHKLDRSRFEACWNEIERFDRLAERAPA